MFHTFSRFQASLSTPQWAALAVLGLLFNLWATDVLNAAYAASGFPVPYWEAQLSFDHLKLKAWYQGLLDQGGIGPYLHAQTVDFLFIASVLVLHMAALVLVSRMHPAASRGRSMMVWAALLSALAPLFDALENGVSFFMLADPLSFAPGLAMLYSTLAAAKFAMFTFAYVAVPVGTVWALWSRLSRHRNRLRPV
ncbi:MAG: hypothetical protein H6933_05915 [Burkholderiaceae bacterium]|nr:hypothetical protein [Rhodoferax sp.]MCP5284414.1 hypothetical protein [Burkholderiaceae bacterium]